MGEARDDAGLAAPCDDRIVKADTLAAGEDDKRFGRERGP